MRTAVFWCLLAIMLAACAALPDRREAEDPTDVTVPAGQRLAERAGAEEIDLGEEDDEDEDVWAETEIFPGTGDFVDPEAAARRYPPPTADGEITLNFEGQGIQEIVHALLGQFLQENYVIAPGVSGDVTFATARPITREQVMPTLEMLLRWTGNTLVWRDDRYHVLPVSDALRGNVPRMGTLEGQRGFEVLGVPMQYISPARMAEVLEPYAGDGAIVSADNARSMLFLGGTRTELRNYLQIIETFDVDWLAGMSIGMFTLQHVDIGDVVSELEAVFGEGGETPLAGMFRFVPMERLNSVMVITPREHYLREAENWIKRLDRASPGAGARLYVYRVKNLEADILAGYLGDLFGTGRTQRPRERRGALAPGLEEARVSTVGDFQRQQTDQTRQQNQGARTAEGGLALGADGDIRITAVEETNSLLIQATPQQYESIISAITRLDEEPLQVLIEAQVLVVDLNDALNYGVNWYLSNTPPARGSSGGGENGDDPPPVGRSRDTDFGDTFGEGGRFLGTITRRAVDRTFVSATIQALESVSDVRTISSPSLMVRNNSEATINVGQQLPVQSTRFVGGGIDPGVGGTIGSVQYLNTGVILEVTPRVNPGGLVYLQLRQEVSSPGDPGVGLNPTVNTRTLSTDVAVQSGHTIILGGLIQETTTDGRSGVPGLQRIPLLGALFRTTNKSLQRTETLVMITPTVVDSSERLREVSDEFRRKFKGLEPLRQRAEAD